MWERFQIHIKSNLHMTTKEFIRDIKKCIEYKKKYDALLEILEAEYKDAFGQSPIDRDHESWETMVVRAEVDLDVEELLCDLLGEDIKGKVEDDFS